jgi:hypothetical protein
VRFGGGILNSIRAIIHGVLLDIIYSPTMNVEIGPIPKVKRFKTKA